LSATVGLRYQKSFVRQQQQRLANRRMADSESMRQLAFDHLYARCKSTSDDIPAKLFGDLIPKAARQTRLGHDDRVLN
jgi:hypothetical protein